MREANKFGAKWNRVAQVQANDKDHALQTLFKMPILKVNKIAIEHGNTGYTVSAKPNHEFSVSVYE